MKTMKKLAAFWMAILLLAAVSCGESAVPTEPAETTQAPPLVSDLPTGQLTWAIYPDMTPYPEKEWTSEEYEAWQADQRARRTFFGQGAGLDEFFAASTATFLGTTGAENLIFSPLNVYMALAMLAETTSGESRAQILALLGVDGIEELRTQAHAIWNANYCDDGLVKSILASSLWLDNEFDAKEEMLELLAQTFYASSFRGETGSAEYDALLHAWMNEQTGDLLHDQIENVKLDPDTVVALVTTIYFKASWESAFSPKATAPGAFHGALGDSTVGFLHGMQATAEYYEGANFTAASLPLAAGGGTMWLILPNADTTAEKLLSDHDAVSFMTSYDAPKKGQVARVKVSVPKFDVSSEIDLIAGLQALGVTDCFMPNRADFSPLTDMRGLYVGEAKHGARVKIDEDGLEAAAYTEMQIEKNSVGTLKTIEFTVDRPFLFVLRSGDGLPLFAGIVNEIS